LGGRVRGQRGYFVEKKLGLYSTRLRVPQEEAGGKGVQEAKQWAGCDGGAAVKRTGQHLRDSIGANWLAGGSEVSGETLVEGPGMEIVARFGDQKT